MTFDFLAADRRINTLAARVDHWQAGAYAGGLLADFVEAQAALRDLAPGQADYARERLERLATRVSIVLPTIEDITGSAAWRCAGIVKSLIDPWHLAKVIAALFPQPSVQARVTMPHGRNVEIWVAMPDRAGQRMLRRIEAVLTRPNVRRVVGDCLVSAVKPNG